MNNKEKWYSESYAICKRDTRNWPIVHLSEENTRTGQAKMQISKSWHVSHLGDSSNFVYNYLVTQYQLPDIQPTIDTIFYVFTETASCISIILIITNRFLSIFRSTFMFYSAFYLYPRSREYSNNTHITFPKLKLNLRNSMLTFLEYSLNHTNFVFETY